MAWALQRGSKEGENEEDRKIKIVDKAAKAISNAQKTHKVLLVYLNVNAETTIRRRANPSFATSTLPFANEFEESNLLHGALGPAARELLADSEPLRDLSIPILEVENNGDGQEFIEAAVSSIISFIEYFDA